MLLAVQLPSPYSDEPDEVNIEFCSTCWGFAKKWDSYNHRFDVGLNKLRLSRLKCRTCGFLVSIVECCIRSHERKDGCLSIFRDSDGDCNGFSAQKPPFELEWHYSLAQGVREHVAFELDLAPEDDKPLEEMYVGMSNISIQTASSWLQSCTSQNVQHHLCNSKKQPFLPTRLLDLGEPNANSSIRICERGTCATEDSENYHRYVALSYCWGPPGSPKLETTTSNLQKHSVHISWKDLPQIFQDAITFIRLLDVRFLWIDSLCIIQDDALDWERESAQMADIYSNAYFTISAATMPHPGVSLFQEISPEMRARPSMVLGRSHLKRRPIVMYAKRIDYFNIGADVREYPLMQRGWVYQEYLLSPRLIFFHETGLGWVCNSCTFDEAESQNFLDIADSKLRYAATLRYAFDKGSEVCQTEISSENWQESVAQEWRRRASHYCSLNLTFETDRLPAIAGIAAQMTSIRPGPYLGGLWGDSLLKDLTWQTWPEKPYLGSSKRPRPTWSWAPLGEKVMFQCHEQVDNECFISEASDAHCELKGSNPFGQIVGGFVKVSGPLFRVTPLFSEGRLTELDVSLGCSEVRLHIRLNNSILDTESDDPGIFCLPLLCQAWKSSPESGGHDVSQTIFLILTPSADPHPHTFERIGLAYVSKFISNYNDEDKRTITIV